MKRLTDYHKDLIESLKDPQEALAYLNAALQNDDPHIFILAFNNTLKAHHTGDLTQSYNPINSNPSLTQVKAALRILDFKLVIQEQSQH